MATRQATCEERLPDHLEGRLEDMRSMVGWYDAWSQTRNHLRAEAAETRLQEYPLYLGVEKTYTLKLELSTGGPADFITAIVEDGRLRDVTYHFQDWFDGATKLLTGVEREIVERYVSQLMDLDSVESYARED